MFRLRYYAPHYRNEIHDRIVQLLSAIKQAHGIEFEVVQLRMKTTEYGSYVDEGHEKEIYEGEFLPRVHTLHHRVGVSLRRALRSRSGHFTISGVVAVVQNNLLEWFTCYESCSMRFPKSGEQDDYSLSFLRSLLAEGPQLLEKLCPKIERARKASVEEEILSELISSNVLQGDLKSQVKIGTRIHKLMVGGTETEFDWRKRIDAVCYTANEEWVIEIKKRLNYEALGEVLTYATLYREQNPSKIVRAGIACREIEEELLLACKKLGVTVFHTIDGKVQTFEA